MEPPHEPLLHPPARRGLYLEWPADIHLDLPPLTLVCDDEGGDLDEASRAAGPVELKWQRHETVSVGEVLRERRERRGTWDADLEAEKAARPEPIDVVARFGPGLASPPSGDSIQVFHGQIIMVDPLALDPDVDPRTMALRDETDTLERSVLDKVSAVVINSFEAAARRAPAGHEEIVAALLYTDVPSPPGPPPRSHFGLSSLRRSAAPPPRPPPAPTAPTHAIAGSHLAHVLERASSFTITMDMGCLTGHVRNLS